MKKLKAFRIEEDLIDVINNYANSNGMNFSEVISQSIINNKNLDIVSTIPIHNNEKKTKRMNLNLDEKSLSKLKKIAFDKNSTIVSEVRYRVLASLEMPCFDTIELKEIDSLRININQIGNLINQSIRNKLIIDNDNIEELKKLLEYLKLSLRNILLTSSKRLM